MRLVRNDEVRCTYTEETPRYIWHCQRPPHGGPGHFMRPEPKRDTCGDTNCPEEHGDECSTDKKGTT